MVTTYRRHVNYLRFPLLALLFLAFCNTCGDASADGHDLEITDSGDDGVGCVGGVWEVEEGESCRDQAYCGEEGGSGAQGGSVSVLREHISCKCYPPA